MSGPALPLDRFDRAILAFLQQDAAAPLRVIGEAVHLSAPAVQRRITRLREAGVIRAEVAVVDPAALGHPLTLIVEVELVSETSADIDAAKLAFRGAPEVQQCYYVTGEVDFVLVVLAPDMAAYEDFTRRHFFDNPNIRKFRTYVTMDRVKSTLLVPAAP